MAIPLQSSYVYGPVNSRRLGRSLGINILPLRVKVCNFNCIYCQYGETRPTRGEFPDAREIIDAVEEILGQEPEIDHITLSGNGEPTLHPKFNIIVDGIKKVRDIIMPHVPIALLTNGTGFSSIKKREAFKLIDKVIVKLDAGDEDSFQRINRPLISIRLKDYIRYLKNHTPLYTQTLFFKNSFSNCDIQHLSNWCKIIKTIKPKIAQIYSLDRSPADQTLKPISLEKLLKIAQDAKQITGVQVEVFGR